jgi:hypothetical protein
VADNVAITAGSGTTIASDDIGGGVQAQRVKPVWGADGTGTDTAIANPLPIQGTIETSQASTLGTIVTPKFGVINTSSSGDTQLVATDSTHKIRVVDYTLVCDAAVAVKFTKGAAGTAMTGAMSFAANGGVAKAFNPWGLFETDTTHDLTINLSGAVGVRGHFTYVLI